MSSPRLAPGAELLTRCAVCSLHRSLRAGQCDRRRRYFCPRCCCTGPNGRKQPNTVSSLLIPHASPVPAAVVCVYLYLSNVLINVPRISTAYRDGRRMLFMFFPRSRPQQHIVGPPSSSSRRPSYHYLERVRLAHTRIHLCRSTIMYLLLHLLSTSSSAVASSRTHQHPPAPLAIVVDRTAGKSRIGPVRPPRFRLMSRCSL